MHVRSGLHYLYLAPRLVTASKACLKPPNFAVTPENASASGDRQVNRRTARRLRYLEHLLVLACSDERERRLSVLRYFAEANGTSKLLWQCELQLLRTFASNRWLEPNSESQGGHEPLAVNYVRVSGRPIRRHDVVPEAFTTPERDSICSNILSGKRRDTLA